MRVLEAGHIYELEQLDGDGKPLVITFVKRDNVYSDAKHEGTQTQEVLRVIIVLIDRTNHCDNCLPWEGNYKIIKAMSEGQRQSRLAIIFHEQRVLERRFSENAETVPIAEDGHWKEGIR